MIANLPVDREVEETYPHIIEARMTEAQLLTLGYASASVAATEIGAATVQFQTSAANVTGAISATVDGSELVAVLSFPLPTSITDAVQSLAYRVVFEPESATSERVICEGTLTIAASPT